MKSLLGISLLMGLVFFVGCKAKILNLDHYQEYQHFLGKRFIIEGEYFVAEFPEDFLVKEKIIDVLRDYSGDQTTPTKKMVLTSTKGVYYMGAKVTQIRDQDKAFEIVHYRLYKEGSYAFGYFILESIETGQHYAILDTGYEIGIKEGYMKPLD